MLARTAAALLSVQAITWLSSLIAILVIPRKLGASELGLLASVTMLSAILAKMAGLGLSNHLVREVARDSRHTVQLAADAIAWRLFAATTVMGVTGLLLWAWGASSFTLIVFALVGATYMVAQLQDVFTVCMQGNYTLGRIAAFTGTVALLTQAAVAAAVLLGGGALHVGLWGAIGGAISALVALLVFSREFAIPRPSLRPGFALVRSGAPFLSWELSLLIYGTADFLMLSLYADGETVGNYALAFRIAGVPIFIAVVITSTIYPALAQAHAQGRTSWFADALTRAGGITFVATLPLAAGIALESPAIIDITGGSGGFTSSALLLSILVVHLPFAAFGTVTGMSLFARDRQLVLAIAAWGAVVLNIVANVIGMPLAKQAWGNPAIGCAIATLLTELYMSSVLLHQVRTTLVKRQLATWGLRAAILTGAVIVTLFLLRPFGILAGIAGAGVVYLSLGYLVAGRALLQRHELPPAAPAPTPAVGQ